MKGTFYGNLRVEPIDGINWRIVNEGGQFFYRLDNGDTIRPEDGFITDFASIPRFLWAIYPPAGAGIKREYGPAAVLHDYLYKTRIVYNSSGVIVPPKRITRKYSDNMLMVGMISKNVITRCRMIIYYAVRIGAWVVWNGYRKKEK